jgi:hypothetical protein
MEASTILAVLGFGLFSAAGLQWLRLIRDVRVQEGRAAVIGAVGLSLVLAVVALRGELHVAAAVAAGTTAAGSAIMLLLVAFAGQSRRVAAVHVGGPILPFTAPDAEGRLFDLASMDGRPYLLKFFRGHW